jgi:hypothetical protein
VFQQCFLGESVKTKFEKGLNLKEADAIDLCAQLIENKVMNRLYGTNRDANTFEANAIYRLQVSMPRFILYRLVNSQFVYRFSDTSPYFFMPATVLL